MEERDGKIKINTVQDDEILELARKLAQRRDKIRKNRTKDREIERSLKEIYHSNGAKSGGNSNLKIKKKKSLGFLFLNFLFFILLISVFAFGAYYYFFYKSGAASTDVELSVESKEIVSAGEEFQYLVKYKNLNYVALKNVSLKVDYPANFIFLESSIKPESGNNNWKLGRIISRGEGLLKIKGKIIDKPKSSSVVMARLSYMPENFSSEFVKDASFNTIVGDIGLKAEFDYLSTALVKEENYLDIILQGGETVFISDFFIKLEASKNIEVFKTAVNRGRKEEVKKDAVVFVAKDLGKNSWSISGLGKREEKIEIGYKVKEKGAGKEKIKFIFEKDEAGRGRLPFFEKEIDLEVINSDLNLVLILNGSEKDNTIDFEERLNYSLTYNNKGEAKMKDVSLMVVLDSDFLDWSSLEDTNHGREKGNTVTWTKEEILSLSELDVGDEGTIDFSLKVMPFKEVDLKKDFRVVAYSQYNIGGLEKFGEELSATSASSTLAKMDNRSNIIVSRINSDLKIREEVRYFDENNMPVGNGPLPPKVGEKTSFRVFWTMNNTLHELSDVQLEAVLPAGVLWDGRERSSVGTLSYDSAANKVIWQIGRLPITVFRADAEFSINIVPKAEDANKIIVLSAGVITRAKDIKTNDIIEKTTGPKTSKLEDDEIANLSSDGRVRP